MSCHICFILSYLIDKYLHTNEYLVSLVVKQPRQQLSVFQDKLGKLVWKCQTIVYDEADDVANCNSKTCKAPVRSSSPPH